MLNYVKKQGGTDMKKKRIHEILNLVFVSLLSSCSCGRHFFEEHEKDAHSICKQCHTLV